MAPARRELLEEAIELLEEFEGDDDVNLKNPPHFVYADMHGNLKLKMSHKVNGRMFFDFKSIVELNSLIKKNAR